MKKRKNRFKNLMMNNLKKFLNKKLEENDKKTNKENSDRELEF